MPTTWQNPTTTVGSPAAPIVARTVTPSPINPTDPTLRGSILQNDLRTTALESRLGGLPFANFLPEIRRRLGQNLSADPNAINLQIHTSPEAIQTRFQPFQTHVPLANGPNGEFNRVVTFSVPANAGNLTLQSYYFDSPQSAGSGWNSNSSFSPYNTNSQRFHNLYEVHVRREGDRFVYTIGMTHGFVGGLRIGTSSGSHLILSHDNQQVTPPPQVTVQNPTVTPRPLPQPPITNPLVQPVIRTVAETPRNTPPLISPVPPPLPNDPLVRQGGLRSEFRANGNAVGGNGLGIGNRNFGGTNPLTPPRTVNGGSGLAQNPLPNLTGGAANTSNGIQSNVSGGSNLTGSRGAILPTNIGGGNPLVRNDSNRDVPPNNGLTLPPLPPQNGGGTVSNLTSSATASLLQPNNGWLSGFVLPIPGTLPNGTPQRPNTNSNVASGPILPTLSGGLPGTSNTLPGGGSSSTAILPLQIPNIAGDLPRMNGTGRVVVGRPSYSAPQFNLPTYNPPVVPTSPVNLARARANTALASFLIRPLYTSIDGLRLPQNEASDDFFHRSVDGCYYLPETGFDRLARLLNPTTAADRNPVDSIAAFSDALLGTGETLPSRGSASSVQLRMNDISSYLSANPTLPERDQNHLRHIRYTLLAISRPLLWSARYSEQRGLEESAVNPEIPVTRLNPALRPTAHSPFTTAIQGVFGNIFGQNQIPSLHVWNQTMSAISNIDPAQIETVHNINIQDIIALRGMLTTAKTTRQTPEFLAHFTASRVEQNRTRLAALFVPGNNGAVNTAAVERHLTNLFGPEAVQPNRTEMTRLLGTLQNGNTAERRLEVASLLLQPYQTQMQFGQPQLVQLDANITRLERYVDRTRLLFRAQTVAEGTDNTVGTFLALLPDIPGSGATANPTADVFQTNLTNALDSIEREYALLGGPEIGGAYATSRRAVLNVYLQNLRRHLLDEDRVWGANLQGTQTRTALRQRLDRDTPRTATAAELPADPVAVFDAVSTMLLFRPGR